MLGPFDDRSENLSLFFACQAQDVSQTLLHPLQQQYKVKILELNVQLFSTFEL